MFCLLAAYKALHTCYPRPLLIEYVLQGEACLRRWVSRGGNVQGWVCPEVGQSPRQSLQVTSGGGHGLCEFL